GSLPATTLATPRSAAAPAPANAAPPAKKTKPDAVITARDAAKAKLDAQLRKQLDSGSKASVYVFVSVAGSPKAVQAMLAGDHTAATPNGALSLVIGRLPTQQLVKLAGLSGVMAVTSVSLKKTASPVGDPDPDVPRNPSNTALRGAFKALTGNEVPYSAA